MRAQVLFIIGPTASGKTKLAVQKALELDGEIVSADSRQFYREMDIGTGKDLEEYTVNGTSIPYHLIDICAAGERYNINRFFVDAMVSIKDILSRGKTPIICGGSGLYIQTLLEGNSLSAIPIDENWRKEAKNLRADEIEKHFDAIEPSIKEKLDASTTKRQIRGIEIAKHIAQHGPPEERNFDYSYEIIGLNPLVKLRRERISKRLNQRLQNGMIEEVQTLLNNGLTPDDLRYYGLEYKWVTDYLEGDITRERLEKGLETAIHQFAKRQMTWFRKMEREDFKIKWI